jgi:hypothetical protein
VIENSNKLQKTEFAWRNELNDEFTLLGPMAWGTRELGLEQSFH